MNVRWKKLLVQTTLWLVAEIWLNFLGKLAFLISSLQ